MHPLVPCAALQCSPVGPEVDVDTWSFAVLVVAADVVVVGVSVVVESAAADVADIFYSVVAAAD